MRQGSLGEVLPWTQEPAALEAFFRTRARAFGGGPNALARAVEAMAAQKAAANRDAQAGRAFLAAAARGK